MNGLQSKIQAAVLLLLFIAGTRAAADRIEESWELKIEGDTLRGTFVLPDSSGPVPVALIIPGSGPTDRDGNSAVMGGKNDSLKLLSGDLAEHGIASLRIDKRGIAGNAIPGMKEEDQVFDDLIADAVGWVEKLHRDPRISDVSIIGHSEGGLVGMIAAGRSETLTYIGIAPPGSPIDQVLELQLAALPAGLKTEHLRILHSLRQGLTVDNVPAPLMSVYRPSVQPYLISFMQYDPAEEIAGLDIPVLLIHGGADLQVPEDEILKLTRANPKAQYNSYPRMNHVMKTIDGGQSENIAAYSDPSYPLQAGLGGDIAAFIRRIEK